MSEGQFREVMGTELSAIRRACQRCNADYTPDITFLVVQKRHHVRLFPTEKKNSDDRNFNVQAGTVVDTLITHPEHIDFYLVSHASIQVHEYIFFNFLFFYKLLNDHEPKFLTLTANIND